MPLYAKGGSLCSRLVPGFPNGTSYSTTKVTNRIYLLVLLRLAFLLKASVDSLKSSLPETGK